MMILVLSALAFGQDDTISKLPCGTPGEGQTVVHFTPAALPWWDRLLGVSYRQSLRLSEQQERYNVACTDALARAVPSIDATRAGVGAVMDGRMATFVTPTATVATDTAAYGGGMGYGSSPFATSGNLTATVLSFDAALAGQQSTSGTMAAPDKSTKATTDAAQQAAKERAEAARKAREEEHTALIEGGS